MDFGISGKKALVLGGSQGLGFAIAKELVQEGAHVTLVSRNESKLAAAADWLDEHGADAGGSADYCASDLSDFDGFVSAMEREIKRSGGFDILINNSGGPPPSGALGIEPQTWRDQFDTMVTPLMTLTELVIPYMKSRQWGRIITIASVSVIEPVPILAMSNTLRASLAAWSKTLSGEVGKYGITCNMLLPGRIATERLKNLHQFEADAKGVSREQIDEAAGKQTASGRIGAPEEFAAAAAFLASDRASYITGEMLRVDGGVVKSI